VHITGGDAGRTIKGTINVKMASKQKCYEVIEICSEVIVATVCSNNNFG
jgi:hypothetical protein